MILFPPAKINLGLNVLFKRSDGFHEIESCMMAVPVFDVLEIIQQEEFSFHQTGMTVDGKTDDNLCVRAFNLFKERYQIGNVYMHLRKEIPMGAGLGGGSADAAYVLRGLNELFQVGVSDVELEQMAATLGSDCPFFIKDLPQLATGRGEVLSKVDFDLHGLYVKLVNPGLHIGTKEAYAGIEFRKNPEKIAEVLKEPVNTWKDVLYNDFETSIFKVYPELISIKEQLYAEGAVYAAMSGSGSTMFGLFKKEPVKSFTEKGFWERIVQLDQFK
jgi:4-diphosphocytidyl-2-C-methyl-D-erythritol kinase